MIWYKRNYFSFYFSFENFIKLVKILLITFFIIISSKHYIVCEPSVKVLNTAKLNFQNYFYYKRNLKQIYLNCFIKNIINNKNQLEFELLKFMPYDLLNIHLRKKHVYAHPFININFRNNTFDNWYFNFQLTHNLYLNSGLDFKIIDNVDINNEKKIQYITKQFYLFNLSNHIVEHIEDTHNWLYSLNHDQLLKEHVIESLKTYLDD